MKDLEVFRNVLRYRWMDKRCADLVELDNLEWPHRDHA